LPEKKYISSIYYLYKNNQVNHIFYLVRKINYREYQGTSIHYKIIILMVLATKFAGTSLDYSINLKIVQTSNSYLENQDKASLILFTT